MPIPRPSGRPLPLRPPPLALPLVLVLVLGLVGGKPELPHAALDGRLPVCTVSSDDDDDSDKERDTSADNIPSRGPPT